MSRPFLLSTLVASSLVILSAVSTVAAVQTTFAVVYGANESDLKLVTSTSTPCSSDYGELQRQFNKQFLVSGIVSLSNNKTGWTGITITDRKQGDYASPEQALLAYTAAGYLEGRLAAVQARQTHSNVFQMATPSSIVDWVNTNDAFVQYLCSTSELPSNVTRKFVAQLCRTRAQARGIYLGLKHAEAIENGGSGYVWTWNTVLQYQLLAEYMDIATATNASFSFLSSSSSSGSAASTTTLEKLRQKRQQSQHCSALVKLLVTEEKTRDVLFAHTTWSTFNLMIKAMRTIEIGGRGITMSGLPCVLTSTDDYYTTTPAKLSVLETTLTMSSDIVTKYGDPYSIPYFYRATIATTAADTAEEWASLFVTAVAPFYANSWMVVDHKKVAASAGSASLPNNTLVVVEQIGRGADASTIFDATSMLEKQSYVASYNLCMTEKCALLSGQKASEHLYGDFFSYERAPRAKIFAHDAPSITGIDDMKRVMRTNRYYQASTNDVAAALSAIPNCSGCIPAASPSVAVAARGDLSPQQQTSWGNLSVFMQGYFSAQAFAAIDAKATSTTLMMTTTSSDGSDQNCTTSWAQMGPTDLDGVPPLVLSKLPGPLQQTGLVGIPLDTPFIYPWQEYNSCQPPIFTNDDDGSSVTAWNTYSVAGVILAGCVVLALILVALRHRMVDEVAAEEPGVVNDQTPLTVAA